MIPCVHAPTSIADAQAIAACFGGTNWRDLFGLGLGTLFVAIVAVGMLLWMLRWAVGRP